MYFARPSELWLCSPCSPEAGIPNWPFHEVWKIEEDAMSDLFVARPLSRRACVSIGREMLIAGGFVLLFSLLISTITAAQTITGTMSGTVTDSSGAVLPGAGVTLVNLHTGDVRKLTTNA